MAVCDLLLTPEATPSSTALTNRLAEALEAWDGPGLLVIAGNLFDLTGTDDPEAAASGALEAHPRLERALLHFLEDQDRRVIHQAGTHEPNSGSSAGPSCVLAELGIECAGPIDLALSTPTSTRVVRIEPGPDAYGSGRPCSAAETDLDPAADSKPGAIAEARAAHSWHTLAARSSTDAPWLAGIDRLSDPSALSRFVTSRTLYRRIGRHAWWLLVPFAVAILAHVAITPAILHHVGHGRLRRTLRTVSTADWEDRLNVAAIGAVAVLAALAVVLGLLSRRLWAVLGGGNLATVAEAGAANDTARDRARTLLAKGYAGLITAATFQPELTNLGTGFFANIGPTAEVVEEHRGRLGLPPVFLHSRRLSWIELETGADLHARLLLAWRDLRSPSIAERLVARRRPVRDFRPSVVASYPMGDSWPPAPDLRRAHRHTRRVRRVAATAILAAGLLDLLDAVIPPLRNQLNLVLQLLPLRATEAAGALVAVGGLALVALGRGILRGQRRAWRVSVALLAATIVLHLVAGADVDESILALVVLAILTVNRREFQAASDWASVRSAVVFLVSGVVGITVLAGSSIELVTHLRHPHTHLPWGTALWAAAERLVGVDTIALPIRLNRFLSPALLALGLALVGLALFLLSRPVVDRRLTSGRAAEYRARDIVRRHGASTLDYFALRSDKRWFFHRDSLVAYAIYGGICLISPDPIGPVNEREQVWGAFRRFADGHGWIPAVMGAGEDWQPIYRASGMHNIYIGDEAVVDVQGFSLAGGERKSLRQAHNRIQKKGYTAEFLDPAHLDPDLSQQLTDLMGLSRRGEHERGFSMMLGRVFDPRDTGLLLTVVRDADGRPAAMCQFVPAPGIDGYSLDLMRRDPGEHPNGLLDFALCSTIEHLREEGFRGLSLNFAALRSTLDGEKGDGAVQRAERWLLKRMSSFVQIETLWRFNAKYDPDWLPRYVVFDTAEHLVPVLVAIVRAESLWEVPGIGKLLAAGAERRMEAARHETELARAELDTSGDPITGPDGTVTPPDGTSPPAGIAAPPAGIADTSPGEQATTVPTRR